MGQSARNLLLAASFLAAASCDRMPPVPELLVKPTPDAPWRVDRYAYGKGSLTVMSGFVAPYGLTRDDAGNLYVPDLKDSRVVRFDSHLKATGWLGAGEGAQADISGWHLHGRAIGGRQPGSFLMAHSVAFDGSGRIYITDYRNGRVATYDADGRYLGLFFEPAPDPQLAFHGPAGADFDAQGNLWVSDFDGNRVYKFGPDLELIGWLGARPDGTLTKGFAREGAAGASTKLGGFDRPHMVQVDRAGNVYVVDRGNHRVQKFRADGTPIGWIGARVDGALTQGWQSDSASMASPLPGGFDAPVSLQLVGGEYFLIADNGNHRIEKFSLDGRFLGWLGGRAGGGSTQGWAREGLSAKGGEPGFFAAPYDAREYEGKLYVADGHNARVQIFDLGAKPTKVMP